jgi:hypothetical protein
MLPQAYVYPAGMRETRDLLRRRLHLVRKRGQLLAHLQNLTHAYQRGAFAKRIAYPSNREGVVAHFAGEPMVQANAALDLALLDKYDELLVELEAGTSCAEPSARRRTASTCCARSPASARCSR